MFKVKVSIQELIEKIKISAILVVRNGTFGKFVLIHEKLGS